MARFCSENTVVIEILADADSITKYSVKLTNNYTFFYYIVNKIKCFY